MNTFVTGLLAALTLPALGPAGGFVTLLGHGGPMRFQSLRDALDVAVSGDTLTLSTGTFKGPENRDLVVPQSLTIRGAGSDVSVIDCQGLGRAFRFEGDILLEGVTIRNGKAEDGGGVYCKGSSSRFRDVVLEDNHALGSGGGIFIKVGLAEFSNCRFRGNVGAAGGGLALAFVGFGGASGNLLNCEFSGNSAVTGGAVFLGGSLGVDARTLLTSCRMTDNTAESLGGGLATIFHDAVVIDRCVIASNTAHTGGGIAHSGDFSPLSDSLIVRNSWIIGNTAETAGGISSQLCATVLQGCIVASNVATEGGPGGFDWRVGPGVLFVNTIIFGNVSPETDLFDQQVLIVAGPSEARGCDIAGLAPAGTNISVDPLFVDAAAGDYHLLPGSPCVDTGIVFGLAATQHDIDGEPRLQGAGFDMGGDEFNPGG